MKKKERKIPKIVAYLSLLHWSHALHSDQQWSKTEDNMKQDRRNNEARQKTTWSITEDTLKREDNRQNQWGQLKENTEYIQITKETQRPIQRQHIEITEQNRRLQKTVENNKTQNL